MRKYGLIAVLACVCLFFAGCGNSGAGQEKTGRSDTQKTTGQAGENVNSQADGGEGEDSYGEKGSAAAEAPENDTAGQTDSAGKQPDTSLRVLGDRQMSCLSDTGYYYITEDQSELKKDFWGRQIMYMDFATKQEVYLCNEPGCKHNDKNCTAVLTDQEVGIIGSALLFVWKDKLYMVSRDNNNENTVEKYIDGSGDTEAKKMPVTIYSMGLDGTNRKKEYTFAQDIMVEDMVLCDGDAIYFTSKQVRTDSGKGNAYTTASNRELVRYQPDKQALETVCSLEFDDQIRWQTMGCHDGKVILRGTKYKKDISLQEQTEMGNEEYWEYARDSTEVFAALNPADSSLKNIYSLKNDPDSMNSIVLLGDYLYVSEEKEKMIRKVSLETGKEENLVKLEQGYISGTLSGKLCCCAWNQENDYSHYFVDCDTGKVEHSALVNKRNGWELEIIGEYQEDVLVIYDYEGKELKEEDAWDISRYQYGLIAKKDLCQGKDRFQKIAMKGSGK